MIESTGTEMPLKVEGIASDDQATTGTAVPQAEPLTVLQGEDFPTDELTTPVITFPLEDVPLEQQTASPEDVAHGSCGYECPLCSGNELGYRAIELPFEQPLRILIGKAFIGAVIFTAYLMWMFT